MTSSPTVSYGNVYAGAQVNILSLNAETGAVNWTVGTTFLVKSSAAIADGIVFIGSDNRNLYVVDALTGTVFKNFQLEVT
jgi:outer membrane protein assembly factor BamB